jgi:hypothetical protein
MIDPTISLGALITMAVALLGFGITLIINAVSIGRFTGRVTEALVEVQRRIEAVEKAEQRMTEVLVDMAKSKIELQLLSQRIDDVQKHGSHRLAEIMADWKIRDHRV